MAVRQYEPEDEDQLREMVRALLPGEPDYGFDGETVFVWEEQGKLAGFASVSLRLWSEATASVPAPHVEAWYVVQELRHRGIGRALIETVERWCLQAGFDELGSDAVMENRASIAAHEAIGFQPGLRLQYFRKRLGR